MTVRWQSALGYALIGVELELPEPGTPQVDALLASLSDAGWDASRIGAHAREVVSAEQPWPHPVTAQLRSGAGPAQFHAALAQARKLLQLQTMETRPPSGRQRLNADELRLMAEVPPHHGH